MTKFLTVFLALTLLSACATPLDKNDIADEGGEDYYGPEVTPVLDEESADYVRGPTESVETTVNADGTYTFAYVLNGETLGQFDMEKPVDGYNAYIYGSGDTNEYIAVDPTGLGGYILYTGAFNLFQINKETHKVKELVFEGLATDIDSELNLIASIYQSESGLVVIVQDFNGENNKVYSVPAEFDQAGDAKINPTGSKVVYQATITSDGSNEETALLVIDLTTGEQTEFSRQEGLYSRVGWLANGLITAE